MEEKGSTLAPVSYLSQFSHSGHRSVCAPVACASYEYAPIVHPTNRYPYRMETSEIQFPAYNNRNFAYIVPSHFLIQLNRINSHISTKSSLSKINTDVGTSFFYPTLRLFFPILFVYLVVIISDKKCPREYLNFQMRKASKNRCLLVYKGSGKGKS